MAYAVDTSGQERPSTVVDAASYFVWHEPAAPRQPTAPRQAARQSEADDTYRGMILAGYCLASLSAGMVGLGLGYLIWG